jgi:prepilin-type N-terminal cleavage/methylation domain-containing protein
MKKFTRGFTLIELLVVIAIIGILSSVVLVSLNSARSKGGDAAVKANLQGIRSQAEIMYGDNGCYTNTGTACTGTTPAVVAAGACPVSGSANIFGQTTIAAQIAAANKAGYGFSACSAPVSGTAWAVASIQKSATAGAADSGWCVDSTGKSKSITVATLDQAGITAEVSAGACVE